MERVIKIVDMVNKAVKDLGITGKVRIKKLDETMVEVYVDGEHLGLYDITRMTFVD